MDEGDQMCMAASRDVDAHYLYESEPALQNIAKYLPDGSMNYCAASKRKASILRR